MGNGLERPNAGRGVRQENVRRGWNRGGGTVETPCVGRVVRMPVGPVACLAGRIGRAHASGILNWVCSGLPARGCPAETSHDCSRCRGGRFAARTEWGQRIRGQSPGFGLGCVLSVPESVSETLTPTRPGAWRVLSAGFFHFCPACGGTMVRGGGVEQGWVRAAAIRVAFACRGADQLT